ncbi:MAG: ATP-binding protein, partial [Anaerolineales bacterium]|nr:ATP-binding protein [Anaerolineales bacterium]
AENLAAHLRLADVNGVVLAYSRKQTSTSPGERLTQAELSRALPLELQGVTIGYLLPDGNTAFTPANEISLVSRLNQAAVTAVGIAGAVAVVLALLLSYSLVRPVRALTQAASRLATGDLSQRVQIKGKDELATLGMTFNHMAGSLQQAQDSRRALTADIAHELRTPLSVQRAHLEAIQDGVYPLELESLVTIEEQNHLLTRLVEDLRTLALADAGQLNLEITPLDMGDLVQRVAKRFEPQAAERKIEIIRTLGVVCPPVVIDSQRIQQILHNLLSNAMRYTPDGGVIRMALEHDHSQISLTIWDTGPGIPEEALTHIFDRFYRGDRSRTRAEGGTGLGLSIARKLAQAHGGDLTAANHPEGGAEFRLSLPVRIEIV